MIQVKWLWIILPAALTIYSFPVLADNLDGPFEYSVQNQYINPVYGFAISIPKGLQGYGDAPPRPNHGICIPLDANRSICANAGFDSLFYGSAKVAILTEGRDYYGAQNIIIKKSSLGKHSATEGDYAGNDGYIYKVVEQWLIDDSPVLYSVRLKTDSAHEVEDTKIFRQVVISFRKTERQ